jgi:hypothetical protein
MNLQEESFHGTGQMSQGIGSLLVAFIVCFLLLCGTPLCAQSAPDQLTKEKLDMIKELLESGEDINEIGPDGKTPPYGCCRARRRRRGAIHGGTWCPG